MEPGELFAARYRLVEHIGAGGMGDVWKATDVELGEDIALKVLTPTEGSDDDTWLDRFRAEVRLARRVTHANVARIFDIGTAGDVHYLTMELVEGESLRKRLRRAPALSLADAIAIAEALASGLAAVHAAGVTHGDVKPGNVMLRVDSSSDAGDAANAARADTWSDETKNDAGGESIGRVVLIDFGLACSVDQGRDPGAPRAGTIAYMAPEQLVAGDDDVGPAADVYALGLVLFELVAHEPPFVGRTAHEKATTRLSVDAPSLASFVAVPAALADVVAQCLARDPARRPRAAEVAAVLARVASTIGSDAPVDDALDDLFVDEITAVVPAPVARTHRLSVLPFRTNGDAHFADGITETLREILAQTSGLHVVAAPGSRSSTRLGSVEGGARAAGLDLGVDLVVAGVAELAAGAVSIRYRLVDIDTGRVLLADKLAGGVADVLGLQDRVARRIAERLRVQLSGEAYRGVVSAEAVATWLDSRRKLRVGPGADPRGAYDDLERCLAVAPRFLLAYAGRAAAAARLALTPFDATRDWPALARIAVDEALDKAPDVPDTHYAAALLAEFDGRYGDIVAALERALRLAPSFAEAHELLGRIEIESGRIGDGSRRLMLATELDPACIGALTLVVRTALFRDRHDVAARLMRRIDAAPLPSFELALLRVRASVWRNERAPVDAKQQLERIDVAAIHHTVAALIDAADGNPTPFLELVASFEKRAPRARDLAFVHQLAAEVLASRDRSAALAHVEDADRLHLFDLEWLDRCPSLASLRDDPRFRRVRDHVARRVLRP